MNFLLPLSETSMNSFLSMMNKAQLGELAKSNAKSIGYFKFKDESSVNNGFIACSGDEFDQIINKYVESSNLALSYVQLRRILIKQTWQCAKLVCLDLNALIRVSCLGGAKSSTDLKLIDEIISRNKSVLGSDLISFQTVKDEYMKYQNELMPGKQIFNSLHLFVGVEPNEFVKVWLHNVEALAFNNLISQDKILFLLLDRLKDGALVLARKFLDEKKQWIDFKNHYLESNRLVNGNQSGYNQPRMAVNQTGRLNSRPYINDRVTPSYLWSKNKQTWPKCYNCRQKGHIAKNCSMQTASVGPSCQFRTKFEPASRNVEKVFLLRDKDNKLVLLRGAIQNQTKM